MDKRVLLSAAVGIISSLALMYLLPGYLSNGIEGLCFSFLGAHMAFFAVLIGSVTYMSLLHCKSAIMYTKIYRFIRPRRVFLVYIAIILLALLIGYILDELSFPLGGAVWWIALLAYSFLVILAYITNWKSLFSIFKLSEKHFRYGNKLFDACGDLIAGWFVAIILGKLCFHLFSFMKLFDDPWPLVALFGLVAIGLIRHISKVDYSNKSLVQN